MLVENVLQEASVRPKNFLTKGWERTFNRSCISADKLSECLFPVTSGALQLFLWQPSSPQNGIAEGLQIAGFITKTIVMGYFMWIPPVIDVTLSIPSRYAYSTTEALLENKMVSKIAKKFDSCLLG